MENGFDGTPPLFIDASSGVKTFDKQVLLVYSPQKWNNLIPLRKGASNPFGRLSVRPSCWRLLYITVRLVNVGPSCWRLQCVDRLANVGTYYWLLRPWWPRRPSCLTSCWVPVSWRPAVKFSLGRYIDSNFCLFANIVIDIINSRSRESLKPRLIQTMKKPTDPDDRVLDQLFA